MLGWYHLFTTNLKSTTFAAFLGWKTFFNNTIAQQKSIPGIENKAFLS
jgi:hypothetical protein